MASYWCLESKSTLRGLPATVRSSKPVRGKAVDWRTSLHVRTSKYGLRVGISPILGYALCETSPSCLVKKSTTRASTKRCCLTVMS